MAGYPLQAVLRLRSLHEEQTQRSVMLCREQVRLAGRNLEEKEERLARFRAWKPGEIERRYAAVLGRSLDQEALRLFRASLTALDQQEFDLIQARDAAERALDESRKKLDLAEDAAKQARAACLRLEKHREIWEEEQKKNAERLMDLELEEVRGRLSVRTEDLSGNEL